VFTGTTTGVLNMRAGNVTRLHAQLTERGEVLAKFDSTGYSDSINDLPLLDAVSTPVVVHADVRLAGIAAECGWKTLQLR
jgi:phosphoserine phosphatase